MNFHLTGNHFEIGNKMNVYWFQIHGLYSNAKRRVLPWLQGHDSENDERSSIADILATVWLKGRLNHGYRECKQCFCKIRSDCYQKFCSLIVKFEELLLSTVD